MRIIQFTEKEFNELFDKIADKFKLDTQEFVHPHKDWDAINKYHRQCHYWLHHLKGELVK